MKAYRYLAKMNVMVGITYRFDLITGVICQMLIMLASVYLWNNAYANRETLEGLYVNQMVTYAVLAVVMSTLFISGVEGAVGEGVHTGSIAVYFLRPISMLGMFFANDIGDLITSISLRTIPTLVLGIFFFHVSPAVSAFALFLSLVSVICSWFIVWLISAIIALSSFWTMKLGSLGYLKGVIISIFSGQLIPVWFFPKFLQDILKFLPFQYIYQAPISIYIGRTQTSEAMYVIAIQAFWMLLLFLLTHFMWMRARQRVLVQGG